MRHTLVAAFSHLAADSQREWCYSELRLQQGVTFLEARTPDDLAALAYTLRPVYRKRGPWPALRLFGMAAAMHDRREGHVVPVADLLGMEEERG
jgi:hypothetical protein